MPEFHVITEDIRDAATSLQDQLDTLQNAVSTAEKNIEPCRGMLGGKRLTSNLESWDDLKGSLNKLIEAIPDIVIALNGTADDIDEVMGG